MTFIHFSFSSPVLSQGYSRETASPRQAAYHTIIQPDVGGETCAPPSRVDAVSPSSLPPGQLLIRRNVSTLGGLILLALRLRELAPQHICCVRHRQVHRVHALWPRSWHRPLHAFRGGLRGAGASSTDSKIAANIARGF